MGRKLRRNKGEHVPVTAHLMHGKVAAELLRPLAGQEGFRAFGLDMDAWKIFAFSHTK
jgi:hypothetical protein